MKSDLEATGSQFFLNSYAPGAFHVLVRIFQFSTEVSLRLAQEFLRETLKGDGHKFLFSKNHSCHLSRPLEFKFLYLGWS